MSGGECILHGVWLFPVQREKKGSFFLQSVHCADSASSRRVLLLSLSLLISLSFLRAVVSFFCFSKEKKNSGDFGREMVTALVRFLRWVVVVSSARSSLLIRVRENELCREGKEREKKNAQSQESLLTVFPLCANYVPPFPCFFLEFSNI